MNFHRKNGTSGRKMSGIEFCKVFAYGSLFLIGVMLVLAFFACKTAEWKDVYLSFGSGFIASALTGFFTDLANTTADKKKHKNLRNSYLDHLPLGFLCAIKGFNDICGEPKDEKASTLMGLFRNLVDKVQNGNFGDSDFLHRPEKAQAFSKRLIYGLSLIRMDAEPIVANRQHLEEMEIFAKDELDAISYLCGECDMMIGKNAISDMVDYLEPFVNEAYEKLPEVKDLLDRKVEYSDKGRIKFWAIAEK